MSRARLTTVPLALVLSGVLAAPALAAPPPVETAGDAVEYRLPGPGAYPEGIGVHGSSFYIGTTSDGTLYEGDLRDGSVSVWSPGGTDGRTTAIGIKATGQRLYVAGGGTGFVFVYDRRSGELLARYTNGGAAAGATFLNDVAIAPGGDAYVTDSRRSVLYRIPADVPNDGGTYPLEVAVQFAGTAFDYVQGFNANGIAIKGRTAYVVQSATGRLFAVALDGSDVVRRVDVRDEDGQEYLLTNGDGLLLQGDRLYVLQNRLDLLTELDLDGRHAATVVSRTTDETFDVPTTLAAARGRVLVVNAQFGDTTPEPFTVSSIRRP